jgi:NAD+ synthase
MIALYQIATCAEGLVVGTGNKVEDYGVGFFTKYGDGGVDISPIADLTKTEVRAMAKELGIAEEILTVAPTDGLWEDARTDESQLGASYEELEWAMSYRGKHPKGYEPGFIEHERNALYAYDKWHKAGAHKLLPIPTFKRKQ